jgi:adenylate cyclase
MTEPSASDSQARASHAEGIFARYVSPEIAEQILRSGGTAPLANVRAAVLFCDIRGFTAYADKKPPGEVAHLLADYWERIVLISAAQGGTVNKFIGDGALVLFGVPTEIPTPVHAAAQVALALQPGLDALLRPLGLSLGIGLHYGDVIAGEIGFGERCEYTVIGTTVNLASRLQSLNKELGSRILVSDAVRREIGDQFFCRALGSIPIRGLSDPVEVFELLGSNIAALPKGTKGVGSLFGKLLELIQSRLAQLSRNYSKPHARS